MKAAVFLAGAGARQAVSRQAGVAKARLLEPLDMIRVDTTPRAVVVGGGIAGLRATLDLAQRGINVTLIERSPFLGGRTAQLHTLYPTEDEARPLLTNLIAAVRSGPRITIHAYAEVTSVEGYIGQFRVGVKQWPRGVTPELQRVDEAVAACPEETANEFEYKLTRRKAIYRPYQGCYPLLPAIDWQTCTKCGRCKEAVGGEGIVLGPACDSRGSRQSPSPWRQASLRARRREGGRASPARQRLHR